MMNQPPQRIDGKQLASQILARHQETIKKLKKRGITPRLALVIIGNAADVKSYIAEKEKVGKAFGVEIATHQFPVSVSYQSIAEGILKLSTDPLTHGISIKQPLPSGLSPQALNKRIKLTKDVDGLLEKSPFLHPLGAAIGAILSSIYFEKMNNATTPPEHFSRKLLDFLKHRKLVLMGRGETGGTPIAAILRKHRIKFFMIHSETEEKEEFITNADIIISAVGKPHLLKSYNLKQGVILLGVGRTKSAAQWIGDYDETAVKLTASYFTPSTNGIETINAACLMENVISAAVMQTQ